MRLGTGGTAAHTCLAWPRLPVLGHYKPTAERRVWDILVLSIWGSDKGTDLEKWAGVWEPVKLSTRRPDLNMILLSAKSP